MSDVASINDCRRRLEAAENAFDADGMIALLADDAVLMVPSEPVQEGKAACARFTHGLLDYLRSHCERRIAYVSAEVAILGEQAFDRGTFSFTVVPRSGGEESCETGKYFFLYSRTAEGLWKISRAIVSLDERE